MALLEIANRTRLTGKTNPMYGKRGKNSPNFGSTRSKETKVKMRAWWTPERRAKMGAANTRENNPSKRPEVKAKRIAWWTPERKAARSISIGKLWENSEFRDKACVGRKGRTHTEEVKAKISATRTGKYTGKNSPNWKGGISSEPYCFAFNNKVKEHIRNLCNRTCTICGQSILQYHKKHWAKMFSLHVDHLDENKMQGCDDREWRLTALCISCHGKMKKNPRHLLLQLLLLNNKRHQTNLEYSHKP